MEKELLKETKNANKNRAAIYYYLYQQLTDDLGEEKGTEILKKALYCRGSAHGKEKYPPSALAGNLEEVANTFCQKTMVKEYLFNPTAVEKDETHLLLKMDRCPLIEQWEEMNLSPEEISKLCEIARAIDYGTFEGALGLKLSFKKVMGEKDNCCLLYVEKAGK